ncbi:hypothetical protein, partial [uncultured Gemmiger sp.]|uniref:hypothetical protein n=1 Tax=uncultured Gemmiger sp. TaxID=1623490 RepID=UPI0025EAEE47
EGISAHYTGKQFIPGGLAAPRGFPPDLSDQQKRSAEWGHFGGGIGAGQVVVKKSNRQIHLFAGSYKLRFHHKTENPLLLKISSKGFLF